MQYSADTISHYRNAGAGALEALRSVATGRGPAVGNYCRGGRCLFPQAPHDNHNFPSYGNPAGRVVGRAGQGYSLVQGVTKNHAGRYGAASQYQVPQDLTPVTRQHRPPTGKSPPAKAGRVPLNISGPNIKAPATIIRAACFFSQHGARQRPQGIVHRPAPCPCVPVLFTCGPAEAIAPTSATSSARSALIGAGPAALGRQTKTGLCSPNYTALYKE